MSSIYHALAYTRCLSVASNFCSLSSQFQIQKGNFNLISNSYEVSIVLRLLSVDFGGDDSL